MKVLLLGAKKCGGGFRISVENSNERAKMIVFVSGGQRKAAIESAEAQKVSQQIDKIAAGYLFFCLAPPILGYAVTSGSVQFSI